MSVADQISPPSVPMPEPAPVKANPRQEASNEMRECVERVLHTDARVPISTYRVQLHKGLSVADARHIVGTLKQLGVRQFYPSLIFERWAGSMNGVHET